MQEPQQKERELWTLKGSENCDFYGKNYDQNYERPEDVYWKFVINGDAPRKTLGFKLMEVVDQGVKMHVLVMSCIEIRGLYRLQGHGVYHDGSGHSELFKFKAMPRYPYITGSVIFVKKSPSTELRRCSVTFYIKEVIFASVHGEPCEIFKNPDLSLAKSL